MNYRVVINDTEKFYCCTIMYAVSNTKVMCYGRNIGGLYFLISSVPCYRSSQDFQYFHNKRFVLLTSNNPKLNGINTYDHALYIFVVNCLSNRDMSSKSTNSTLENYYVNDSQNNILEFTNEAPIIAGRRSWIGYDIDTTLQ